MSLYRRTARDRCEEADADLEREYPSCRTCDGRIGLDCAGHEEEAAPEAVKTIGQLAEELRQRRAIATEDAALRAARDRLLAEVATRRSRS